MNKYENIDIVDVDYEDDIIDKFIEDVENLEDTYSSVAVIGSKELISFTLDSLTYIEHTPSINKVHFGDEDVLHIAYVSSDYELYILPLDGFKYNNYVEKVYIDSNCNISQTIIDGFINNDTNVVLFSVSDENIEDAPDKNTMCNCKENKNTNISLTKSNGEIHGFSATKTTDNSHYSYSYYSSDKLTKDDISMLIKEFGL